MKEKAKSVVLELDDIANYISFRNWLSKNISHFKERNASKAEMLIYLNFIKDKLYSEKLLDKKNFILRLKKLIKRIRTKDD